MFVMTSYHERILKVIKYLIDTYGQAFPSYRKLAELGGMGETKAVEVVKELVAAGKIRKTKRFVEVGGRLRQQSNLYEIIEEPKEEPKKEPKKSREPYIKSFIKSYKKSFKKSIKKDDDDNIKHYRHEEFFKIAQEQDIPKQLAAAIFKLIKDDLIHTSWTALYLTFNKMRDNIRNISHIPSWFKVALKNANYAEAVAISALKRERGLSLSPAS
jgi:ribosomal protein S20